MFLSPHGSDVAPGSMQGQPEARTQWSETPDDAGRAIDAIIAIVRDRTGVDFSLYRRATIQRRIGNRMISIGANSLCAYVERLNADAGEVPRLLERLTIKVSRFYRNARTFDFLAEAAVPALARARRGAPLRVWSAGCGCGEEAYTLAMLLEAAGVAGTVDATDVDPAALDAARDGIYGAEALDELPAHLAQAYLRPVVGRGGTRYRVNDVLRERVRFARHDLTAANVRTDGGCFDLVCCRNVLIYLDRDAQRRAFESLNASLADDGFLCIGEAEWPLPEVAPELAPQGHKTQVFRRVACGKGVER